MQSLRRSYPVIGPSLLAAIIVALELLGFTNSLAAIPGDLVGTCESLDGGARAALQRLLDDDFPPPDSIGCDLHAHGAQIDLLARHRDGAIPCLLGLQRGDLRKTTLWRRPDPVPDVRRWSTGIIGQIDPVLGIRLYTQMLGTSSSRWDRLSLRLLMARFGDRPSQKAIVSLLQDLDIAKLPHVRQETVLEAIYALVRYDDRDVLPTLSAAHSAFGAERRYLGAWVAQLERDLPTLERFARDPTTSGFALESLGRIGARDVLQRLAADLTFYDKEKAKMVLEQGPPPLPVTVDVTSRCLQLDERGKRELTSWIVFFFPPPGTRGSDCGTQSLPFALMNQKETASACLEDIYVRGLTGTGVWPGSTPEPYPGTQTLSLLGQVDAARAAALWREWRDSPARTAWQRGYADSLRLSLGDRDAVSGLVTFLRESLDAPRATPDRPDYLIEEAAAALIRIDHRPARSLLEKWRARGALKTGLFDIGVAQLGRDSAELERLARESNMAGAAIEALGLINARDVLKRLADDPEYKYRYWAMDQLQPRRPAAPGGS
jgi:hypothetical protein